MIKFYGYKRCSTSRKAEKWLTDHNVKYEFQDLVAKPPKKEEILSWMKNHPELELRKFFNTSGQHYRQMHLKDKVMDMSMDEAADLMSQDGKLIKRPVVIEDGKMTIGFKEENYEQNWQ